jgi:hypothetical protein
MGNFVFAHKFQCVYELWPTIFFARPSQILSRFQFKKMFFYASKTAPIWPFDIISSIKQVFDTLWTRLLHIQKSKIFYFDQIIVQNQSWKIC